MDPGSQRSLLYRIRTFLIGRPKDISDRSIFHKLALIPFLAWVGLGSDGLSSSAYGPEEAFKTLGEHAYLAIVLVVTMAFTVIIISAAYSKIIEAFPHGGGGYVVASALLGRRAGVVSGAALLVDYVLTITISIAAAGDALFSFIPSYFHNVKLPMELGFIIGLTMLNLRGVKESVLLLAPIFILFIITHVVAIVGGIVGHIPYIPNTITQIQSGFAHGSQTLGWPALFLLFVHAYSLGGGTYTGIEAVSNGLPIMREPKVATAKRTMMYMSFSLAFTASGLLLCYLLWNVHPVAGKTLNAVLFENLAQALSFGTWFMVVALIAEGLLLIVAAQAGFIDGPRVLANMAVDSWVPRRLAAVSERLTTANGIMLMGISSIVALLYTNGDVGRLVVMYSINVFLTFSLSILGMLLFSLKKKKKNSRVIRSICLFFIGFVLCATILIMTILEKFLEGGWITVAITAGLVMLCFWIKRHYIAVANELRHLHVDFSKMKMVGTKKVAAVNPKERTAVILVGGYGNLGLHTIYSILKTFPDTFRNFVFVSIGVIDSGIFKGEEAIEHLREDTEKALSRYVDLAKSCGIPATFRFAVGTEIVQTGFEICEEIAEEFPQSTFFTGKVIFEDERWYQRLLHNETAFSMQKRLHLAGHTMVVLPAKVG